MPRRDTRRGDTVNRIALALATALALAGCTRDIRPETLERTGAWEGAGVARGRALLAKAEAAHGGRAAFEAYDVMTVELHDVWTGLARLANPWPEAEVRVRMDIARARLTIRAEFLEGDDAGVRWGLAEGRAWTAAPGGAVDRAPDDDVRFILAALQYLLELPFRIGEAPVIVDAGPETVGGRTYDRVFATWDGPEPSTDHDQYVVYIDRETGRVEKVHFTVRAFARFVESTIHYDDFREVGGLLLPHRLRMTDTPTEPPADAARRLTIERIDLDRVPVTDLAP